MTKIMRLSSNWSSGGSAGVCILPVVLLPSAAQLKPKAMAANIQTHAQRGSRYIILVRVIVLAFLLLLQL
jgi:hypothetical protein